jgi:type IV pilus assembly protein PilC
MPAFSYTALDKAGKQTSGGLSGESRAAIVNQLLQQGLVPVSVNEKQEAASAGTERQWFQSDRIPQSSIEAFTRELANLLAAGVPLSQALSIIGREVSRPAARRLLAVVHDDVVGGMALADALAKAPKCFPPVYVAMVRAGETGGFLDLVLGQIADFRSREADLKGKVKAALVYPSVLAVMAVGVLTFLMTFFIPRFSAIFAEFGGNLPWLTQMIVGASKLIMHYGVVVIIFVVLIVLAVRRVMTSEAGRRTFERTILRVPGLGQVVARFALVRFCRMLGTLVGAGVPLVSALRVAKEAIGNQTLADTVGHAIDEVKRGKSLAKSLAASRDLFPASVSEMVSVAEESGKLDKELVRLAGAYEMELDRRLRMLVALAEPMMLFVMAALVGTVVIGMLLPVFTLQELIK